MVTRPGRSRRVALLAVLLLPVAGIGWFSAGRDEAPLSGRVVSPTGAPIAGAVVETVDGRRARSDERGIFSLQGDAAWVTVSAQGWVSRTRVLAPGSSGVVRLVRGTADTVTFVFGGDVMFGRRYYDAAEAVYRVERFNRRGS